MKSDEFQLFYIIIHCIFFSFISYIFDQALVETWVQILDEAFNIVLITFKKGLFSFRIWIDSQADWAI